MNNLTPTVKNLIVMNAIMYALGFAIPYTLPNEQINFIDSFGLYYPSHPNFKLYQFFTHFFIHANFLHIAFNMISLYSIGSLLESYWGSMRLLNFYLLCGLGAGFFYTAIQGIMIWKELEAVWNIIGTTAVGASGAVFGLFAAVAVLFPNSEFFVFFIPFPIKAKYLLVAAIVISAFLGMASIEGDQVAHFGHLGGIVTGFLLTKYLNKRKLRFY